MSYNPATVERQHLANQAAQPSMHFAMRACTGACKKRRSVGQFAAGSTVCIRCARSAP
jgi:hypothetical protein